MRLFRDHIITPRRTRLAMPRATKSTAILTRRCKSLVVGRRGREARRIALDIVTDATAAAEIGAASTAAEAGASKRDVRGFAAEDAAETADAAETKIVDHRDSRCRDSLDPRDTGTLGKSKSRIRHVTSGARRYVEFGIDSRS